MNFWECLEGKDPRWISAEVESVEVALRECEVDTCAFQYVKKIKSLNVSLVSANSASRSSIVDWAKKLYGRLLERLELV